MIPLGYMLKKILPRPKWIRAAKIIDVFSVAGVATENFSVDYIDYWCHNGFWFFNSPSDIKKIATENNIDTSGMTLFYYEAYELEFDISESGAQTWLPFVCSPDFETDVTKPKLTQLAGFDVVEYVCGNAPEASLASACDDIGKNSSLNEHCLFDTFDNAKVVLETGIYNKHEPGPYRILAVYVVISD